MLWGTQVDGQLVRFTSVGTRPNDTSVQSLRCNLDAERTIQQHRQVVDRSNQQLRRDQQRQLTVLKTEAGLATEARVTYQKSTNEVTSQGHRPRQVQQPVHGQTYLVSRHGDELSIVKEGEDPLSEEEEKLLRSQLATFGKPNPLARFLHGRQIRVGDSLPVPDEVAKELLGLTGNEGETEQLVLKLVKVDSVQGIPCAHFETRLRTSGGASSLTLLMKGQIVMDPSTCRTLSIELAGPVALSETRGPAVARYLVSTNGMLKVAVENQRVSQAARRGLLKRR